MKKTDKKPVYIKSIEAAKIYTHINRDEILYTEYVGMIPFSLELMKLRQAGLVEIRSSKGGLQEVTARNRKNTNRILSDDVINIKFDYSVRDADDIIKGMELRKDDRILKINESKLKTKKEKQDEINELEKSYTERISEIKTKAVADPEEWENRVSVDELREQLYQEGFTLENYKGEKVKYVAYKRSSAKSREGECLFIKEQLHDEMVKWSRLSLPFEEGVEVDLAGLMAYESLVGSSIEDLVKIPVDNILLISDVDSKFKRNVNVVQKSPLGLLSREEETTISNSLYDGQSLLSSEYFTNGRAMMLLRNHMFKSAAFNTNIQQFLMDHKPGGIEFDEWEIEGVVGKIKAKDVHFITTPSSLKVLKFSKLLGSNEDMFIHWKNIVKEDGELFGVCKNEKESKRGRNEQGEIMQRLSYQMVNSLPATKKDIQQLSEFEVNYIDKLKNDNEVFANYLEDTANISNVNAMYVELYKQNPKIANTKIFKDFKKKKIFDYVDEVNRGKIRVVGDYAVLVGNPFEMLLHSIGQLLTDGATEETLQSHSLVGNQVYSSLFENDEWVVGFRNPHTSPSNILLAQNKHNEQISKYFNLTDNIVAVNAINFELQDLLSGCDYDSDTLLLSNDKTLVKLGEKSENYKVCVNAVPAKNKVYTLNNKDRYEVDKELANDNIGKVVNLGQNAQSVYWDAIQTKRDNHEEIIKDMKEAVEIVSVLSTIAIDAAKRAYEINIVREINILKSRVDKYKRLNRSEIKCDPQFFRHTAKKEKVTPYETPMDYLVEVFSSLKRGKKTPFIDMWELVNEYDENGEKFKIAEANDNQERSIITIVNEAVSRLNGIYALAGGDDNEEMKTLSNEIMEGLCNSVARRKVEPVTIYAILYHMFNKKSLQEDSYLLNALYITQRKIFVNSFYRESRTIFKKVV